MTVLLALLACTKAEDDTGGAGDAASVAESGICANAPVETFETFGSGFLLENCQSCHASTSTNRNGAPGDVVFDDGDGVPSVGAAWTWAERILARAATDTPTMPPMAGTTEDDRQRLTWWLTCAEPGT